MDLEKKNKREAILRLLMLTEKQIVRSKATYLAFVDLGQPFDNVNRTKIILTLREIWVKQRDLKIIHSLYENQTACIKGETTADAQIKKFM